MADEVVIGLNAFTEQPIKRSYKLGSGWVTTREWVGPQALADSQENYVLSLEPETVTTTEGVPCIISADFSDPATSTSADEQTEQDAIWELVPVEFERDLRGHGLFRMSASQLNAMEAVDSDIKKGQAFGYDYDTRYGTININTYRDKRLSGIDAFWAYSYNLKRTLSTKSASTYKLGSTETGKVITWDNLKTTFRLPVSAKFDQPKIHWYRGTIDGGTGWETTLLDQWMIKPASVRFSKAKLIWEISQEFWGATAFDSDLYHITTTP